MNEKKPLRASSSNVEEEYREKLKAQMEVFKRKLEIFTFEHKKDLKNDPEFRKHFQEMCSLVGVDPLQSNKGFWGELLGVGDFYYELGVQIVEICRETRDTNGGLILLEELVHLLTLRRGLSSQPITEYDVARAIKKLSILGEGYQILDIDDIKVLQSLPREFNMDHTFVLKSAHDSGYVTENQLRQHWSRERFLSVMNSMIEEGMVWVDDPLNSFDGSLPELLYWVPGLLQK